MENLVETVDYILASMVSYIWGLPMVCLLAGAGLFFTIYLRGIQFTGLLHGIRVVLGHFDKESDPGEISHFRALCSALSATVGLGNIAGVAVAIHVGGPGATFWMILVGFLGMVTKYVECTLSISYRRVDQTGEVHGGPMHYIAIGLGERYKPMAAFYAVCLMLGGFGAVAMFQSNQVAQSFQNNFGVHTGITGAILCVLTAVVIAGGIKRIGAVAGRLVPVMASIYIGGCVLVLLMNATEIPAMLSLIASSAFSGVAAGGGMAGIAVREVLVQGARRACFSNEAGLGTAAIAHSAARTSEAAREGAVAMLGPLIDTVIICTMTSLVIISSGLWRGGLTGIELTTAAFEQSLPGFGAYFLPIAVFLFCYSTLISWYYYGERGVDYLFGASWCRVYKMIFLTLIIVGAMWKLDPILNFADSAFGLMVIPNVIAIVLLRKTVKKLSDDYFSRVRAGEFVELE